MFVKKGILSLLGLNPTGDLGPLTCYTSRRAGTVWFLKSPPTKPPSVRQLIQRNRFRCAALAWQALTQDGRDDWHLACRRAHLVLHGYQLWIWWQTTRDRPALATIERISRISLAP